MGEIAEMMLEGVLCQFCGVALVHGPDDEACGYPSSCGCDVDQEDPESDDLDRRTCHECGKVCKNEDAVLDHLNAKHPGWQYTTSLQRMIEIAEQLLEIAQDHEKNGGDCSGADLEQLEVTIAQTRDLNREIFE